MILVVDNYDSFTYNLVQYIESLGETTRVVRNDETTTGDIRHLEPDGIVISPGPRRPEEAGCSMNVVRVFTGHVPILGVCLGHQCIGRVFGAEVTGADRLMHGKTSAIYHDRRSIFSGVPSPFEATRYHSLIVDEESLRPPLLKTAYTSSGAVMGLRHTGAPVEGIQFHPESILTEQGLKMMENFCDRCRQLPTSTPPAHIAPGTSVENI